MRIAFLAALLMANYAAAQPRVYKPQINPNWFNNSSRLWYRNDLSGGRKEFILVDAVAATRQSAFDHQKLAAALSKASGVDVRAERLPFDSIEFIDDAHAIRFSVADSWWKC